MAFVQELAAEAERAITLHKEYRRLLGLVAAIKAGQIDPRLVQIDWIAESWEVVRMAPAAPLPGQEEAVNRLRPACSAIDSNGNGAT
jgi:hypothetical protein